MREKANAMASLKQLLSTPLPLVLCLLWLAPHALSAPVTVGTSSTAKVAPSTALRVAPVLKEVVVELELIRVLALSQSDGRAVLAFPDGVMVTAQSGEAVPRTGAVLKQVLSEKLILEQVAPAGTGKQLIWMHKAQGAKPGRVERFSSLVAPTPAAPAPVSRTISLPQPGSGESAAPARKP